MKRLTMVTTLLLAAASTSVWAQAPATDEPRNLPQAATPAPAQPTPPAAMPMNSCMSNHDTAVAQNENANCPMASGDMKSDQGAMHMHRMMMQGMMHGQPQPDATQSDQTQGGSPRSDKLQ